MAPSLRERRNTGTADPDPVTTDDSVTEEGFVTKEDHVTKEGSVTKEDGRGAPRTGSSTNPTAGGVVQCVYQGRTARWFSPFLDPTSLSSTTTVAEAQAAVLAGWASVPRSSRRGTVPSSSAQALLPP